MTDMLETRRRAWKLGARAETWAAFRLGLTGHRVLGRRVKTPLGEIDILARRGHTLIAVEVKARTPSDPRFDLGEVVSRHQRQRIERALEWAVAQRPDWQGYDLRFDVIMVAGPFRMRHFPDAWRP